MSKKLKKKTQKAIISIVAIVIVAVFICLGVNENVIRTIGDITGVDVNGITNIISSSKVTNINSANDNGVDNNGTSDFIADDNLKVYFIDVGQADSILIMNGNQSMLIDAGNNDDGDDVVKYIKAKGITKLNYVVGTHPHEDHIGGLDDVINQIDIENVLMPKMQTNTNTFEDVLNAISNKGLKVTAPEKGYSFKLGESNLEVMTDSIEDEKNLNLSSITLRLTFGNNSFLFMGDAETKNEKTIEWPQTDVLKVGHHGSSTSSSESFINQVKPKYAIVMVGEGNTYNLPKEQILARLQNIGAQIYRTDKSGTIEATSNGNNIEFKTEK